MDIGLKTWILEENHRWEYSTSLIIMFSESPEKSDLKSCIKKKNFSKVNWYEQVLN